MISDTPRPRPSRRAIAPSGLIAAVLAALVMTALAVAPTAAATRPMVPACPGANLRTGPSTTAPIKVKLSLTGTVVVSGTVSGSRWSTVCPTAKAGSSWYVISSVNGTSVRTRYGVRYLYVASGVLVAARSTTAPSTAPAATASAPVPLSPTPTATPIADHTAAPTAVPTAPPPPAPTAAPTAVPTPAIPATTADAATAQQAIPACDGINLRTGPSTTAPIKVKLGLTAVLTVAGQATGSAWSTACPTAKTGSSWYLVTAINGAAVSPFGTPVLYAAAGVLVLAAPTPPTAAPTVAPTVVPTPSPTGAPTPIPSVAPTGAPSASPAVAPVPPVVGPASSVVVLGPATTFFGRGYGHGVGLSQYGARGRALAGQLAPEILAHYYQGTTIGSLSADPQIRVLVLDAFRPTADKPLTLYGRGGDWTIGGLEGVFPADARLQVFPPSPTDGTSRLVIDLAGTVLLDGFAPADFRVQPVAGAGVLQLFTKPTSYDRFRGTLRVIRTGATTSVVNELPLETYLRGVVPGEMPSTWPVEARIAQTIAARSYAAYRLHPGVGTFDVYDDTRSQVYLGALREMADADAIVQATAGQVLLNGSSIVNALFHSTGGGATENNENVYTSATGARNATPVSYLRGSSDRDPNGVSYDAGAPHASWHTRSYSVTELSTIFALDTRTNVGTLSALDFRNRGVSGRLVSVTLIGSAGSKTVAGSIFVGVFNTYRDPADPMLWSSLLDVAPIP